MEDETLKHKSKARIEPTLYKLVPLPTTDSGIYSDYTLRNVRKAFIVIVETGIHLDIENVILKGWCSMTKKELQVKTNEKVVEVYQDFLNLPNKLTFVNELRSCTATVFECEHYYVLMSYSTIIALIDKEDNMCYDFLRYVWGYSNTSAKHIAYFQSDYGIRGKVMTYREV